MRIGLPQCSAVLASTVALLAGMAGAQTSTQTNMPAVPQASTQASPFGGTVVEDVIARVNDQIISRSDYERAEQDLEQRARQSNMPPQQIEAERRDLLRDLVDQQLLLSRGKELDITGETELVRELDDIRKQNHLDSMEDLQKAAEAQGVNYEDFKANIRNRIITQDVIRQEVGRHLNLTQADVQRYYERHKADYNRPESVHLAEIMVPVSDPAASAVAQAKAEEYEAKLKAGADFDQLVKDSSAGSTAPLGGDLGSFPRGKLPKVLEDQTFVLKSGEYTKPIQTRQGFIILKVLEHQPGGQMALKDVQPQVEDALAQERVQPAVRAYLAEARLEAYVVYKPGYVDSAAVVNPSQIVYSAASPPAPKKKKKTVRTRYRQKSRRTLDKAADTQTASAPAMPSLADAPHADSSSAAATGPAAATTDSAGAARAAGAATAAGAAAPAVAPRASASQDTAVASTGKTRESARKKGSRSSDVATTERAGKREKIRFGQAPRETLPANDNTREIDAHATGPTEAPASTAPAETQVASADIPEQAPDAQKAGKKRFSARAKLPKVKKSKTPPPDPYAPPPLTPDEIAAKQAQSAPLGLAGDTAKPVKKKKVKPTEKTRLQDQKKPDDAAPPADGTIPAPGEAPLTTQGSATAAPPATTPAAAPATPLGTNPVQTPPTNTQGVPTPGEGNPATPAPPPQ
ncbi:MAG TPA: peptidyl-prolyl cis-trans isomerase [Acidisarcina sp.]